MHLLMKGMQHWCTYCIILFSCIFCSDACLFTAVDESQDRWFLWEASNWLPVGSQSSDLFTNCSWNLPGDADANLVRASPSFPLWVFISLGGLVFCLAHSSRHLCRPVELGSPMVRVADTLLTVADSWGGALGVPWMVVCQFIDLLFDAFIIISSIFHNFSIILSTFYPCFVDCSRKTSRKTTYLSRIIIMHISLWHTSARMNRDGKKELGAYRICREFLSIATRRS